MTHSNKNRNKKFQQPHNQLVQQQKQTMMMKVGHSFSGPLPPPEILEKYNQVMPGLAERIIGMAEQQSRHRQGLERTVVDSNAFVQKIGPFLGFIVAMTAVIGGIFLILKGKDGYGLAAIIGALASLAGVFIYGKSRQRKELDAKAEDFVRPQ
ncbi:MAG: DUF2335 domain-containing protein [Acidobacteriia bacterium]|nr:DUF2335 domain-containing protein [Terriglobia bacterium]